MFDFLAGVLFIASGLVIGLVQGYKIGYKDASRNAELGIPQDIMEPDFFKHKQLKILQANVKNASQTASKR